MAKTLKYRIAQALDTLARMCAASAALGMVTIVGIIVVGVFMRKFANSPLHFTEEVVGLLLSVSLFLGLPLVTLRARHVQVSILARLLTGKWRAAIDIAAVLVSSIFFIWLLVESIPWLEFAFDRNLKTETTRILLYPWMALLPLSLGLSCLILLARIAGIVNFPNSKNDSSKNDSSKNKKYNSKNTHDTGKPESMPSASDKAL
ncbi:TRAP transporter small permease [Granulosicoccus sp.]|nr:TRAP transporter small permease [Granulosicoccus sp.]